MPLGVLLNDVPDIVGLPRLLELPAGHEVLDLPYGADSVLVGISQAKMGIITKMSHFGKWEMPRFFGLKLRGDGCKLYNKLKGLLLKVAVIRLKMYTSRLYVGDEKCGEWNNVQNSV